MTAYGKHHHTNGQTACGASTAEPPSILDSSTPAARIPAHCHGASFATTQGGADILDWLAGHNSVRLFGRLLAAGIEIQEFNRTMLHQKTMVVDRRWVTVGTANFDNRSFAHNDESNVCVLDRALAEQLHATSLDDLNGCERLTLERWRTRGLWPRAQELVAAILQEQA